MHRYSLDIIFPMLQFLSIHVGYTIWWVALSTIISDKRRIASCIAIGGISAVVHQDIMGMHNSVVLHLGATLTAMLIYVIKKLLSKDENTWVENPVCVADLCEQEKNILTEIDELCESGQLSEPSLEKIYKENKEFIDTNSLIKCRVFNEVISWRKQKNITCRAVTVAGQRQFLNVNFRSVDWLK